MAFVPDAEQRETILETDQARHGPDEASLRRLLAALHPDDEYWFYWMSEDAPWAIWRSRLGWHPPEEGGKRGGQIANAGTPSLAALICVMRDTVPALLAELDHARAIVAPPGLQPQRPLELHERAILEHLAAHGPCAAHEIPLDPELGYEDDDKPGLLKDLWERRQVYIHGEGWRVTVYAIANDGLLALSREDRYTAEGLLAEAGLYIAELLCHAPLGGADRTRYGPDLVERIVAATGTPIVIPGEASDAEDKFRTIGARHLWPQKG